MLLIELDIDFAEFCLRAVDNFAPKSQIACDLHHWIEPDNR
jgi:hypothetical protein